MKQELIRVEGMTCQHCVHTIREELKKILGLISIDVDLDKKEVDVRYDENKTSLIEITKNIIGIGFDLTKN